MNTTRVKQSLKYAWQHKHMVYSYLLLRLAMVSPFVGLNAFFHKLRGVIIGKEVKIAHDVLIDSLEPQSVILEDYVTISPRVTIHAHTTPTDCGAGIVKPVRIRESTWICVGATILPGVTVGRYCVIGAGAVIAEDIPDFTLAFGIPAKPVRTLKKIYEIPKNATLHRVLVLEDENLSEKNAQFKKEKD